MKENIEETKQTARVIEFPRRGLLMDAKYMERLERRFSRDQVVLLAVLMARSAKLHEELEDLYQEAVELLDEETVQDESDRWAHDAIYNSFEAAA